MYEYREHAPHQLSGGQKQRVAIAGVIAMRPRCIVLDEPTAMLDPRGRAEVMKTLRALNRDYGITVALITHYMDEAAQCDRVVVVDSGRVQMCIRDSPRGGPIRSSRKPWRRRGSPRGGWSWWSAPVWKAPCSWASGRPRW